MASPQKPTPNWSDHELIGYKEKPGKPYTPRPPLSPHLKEGIAYNRGVNVGTDYGLWVGILCSSMFWLVVVAAVYDIWGCK
jgi:hypothetical protein